MRTIDTTSASSPRPHLVSAVAHHRGYPALGRVSSGEASLDCGRPIVDHHVVPDHPQLLRIRLLALVLHCLSSESYHDVQAWILTFQLNEIVVRW